MIYVFGDGELLGRKHGCRSACQGPKPYGWRRDRHTFCPNWPWVGGLQHSPCAQTSTHFSGIGLPRTLRWHPLGPYLSSVSNWTTCLWAAKNQLEQELHDLISMVSSLPGWLSAAPEWRRISHDRPGRAAAHRDRAAVESCAPNEERRKVRSRQFGRLVGPKPACPQPAPPPRKADRRRAQTALLNRRASGWRQPSKAAAMVRA